MTGLSSINSQNELGCVRFEIKDLENVTVKFYLSLYFNDTYCIPGRIGRRIRKTNLIRKPCLHKKHGTEKRTYCK